MARWLPLFIYLVGFWSLSTKIVLRVLVQLSHFDEPRSLSVPVSPSLSLTLAEQRSLCCLWL